MTRAIALGADRISGGYTQDDVIKGISFDLPEGGFLGIIGPNGCGKSTLLRIATGAMPLRSGSVTYRGREIRRIGSKEFARSVSFVPQDTFINFPFTALEIVLMGRIPHLGRLETETRKDIEIAERSLEMTDTSHLRDKAVDSLSAGERQRIVIARALAQEPSLIMLDEPTSHLDIGHQVMVLDLLKRLNSEKNLSIAIVLHDLNLASEYCDRLLLLDGGRIFSQGSPEDVLTYQNIEKVYKTVVVVNKSPISSKPYVVLVSGADLCRRK
jgi:iron complex transport system ATP-binding protein